MSEHNEIQWHPVERLDYVLTLIRTSVPEAREQLESLRGARHGSLDQAIVDRAKRVYTERVEMNGLFREQLARWRRGSLSEEQEKKVKEALGLLDTDDQCAREILEIVGGLVSIDKIISMSDIEVGVRSLAGEFDPPPHKKKPK